MSALADPTTTSGGVVGLWVWEALIVKEGIGLSLFVDGLLLINRRGLGLKFLAGCVDGLLWVFGCQ